MSKPESVANPTVIPVILSGGSGTRLWPLSRKLYPKQFLKLCGDTTMLQATAERVAHLAAPIIVCNEEHRFIAAEQLRQVNVTPSAILLEPEGKNTAPAVMLAALEAQRQNPDAVIAVLAADHLIDSTNDFRESLKAAVDLALQDKLVTFGVKPTSPETGYGYINADIKNGTGLVNEFVEKPTLERAQAYLASGDYLWNSGMFVFKAKTFIRELTGFEPAIASAVQGAWEQKSADLDFTRVNKELFSQSPAISIDYAVMERTKNAVVVELATQWSDIGNFKSLWDAQEKDQAGNAVQVNGSGRAELLESHENYIHTENQLIATVGVDNLVIAATKDAVLIADKNRPEDIKTLVKKLQEQQRPEFELHRQVYRPWGYYDSVDQGERFQVKRITVYAGESLSKQKHFHRAEHWVVVSGTALVEIDDQEQLLAENESVYIPIGAVHRLTNPGKTDLQLIEVQSGSYLGEDDIVRFEDKYARDS